MDISTYKEKVKFSVLRAGNRFYNKNYSGQIVVGSIGRSGSSMLNNSIAESIKTANGLPDIRFCKRYHWNGFNEIRLEKGTVVKTHSNANVLNGVSYNIFVYSDYTSIVNSLYRQKEIEGNDWLLRHFDHLGINLSPEHLDCLLEQDLIGYRRQMNSWKESSQRTSNTIMVRLDDLWKNRWLIEDLIQLKIKLPERRETGKNKIVSSFMSRLDKEFGF